VETSAGEPLISEALRCYKVVGLAGVERIPISQAPCLVTLNLLQYLTAPPPAVVSLQTAYKKHSGYKNPLFPILWEDKTNVQECLHMVKLGVQRVASEPP